MQIAHIPDVSLKMNLFKARGVAFNYAIEIRIMCAEYKCRSFLYTQKDAKREKKNWC